MFLLLCPHIQSNRLGSRATCFPGNICPTLSQEPHWLHTWYHHRSLPEVAEVGCVVGMGLVPPVLTGIYEKWGGQSRNVGVGEEWTSVSWGLRLLHMGQGSSQRVSLMVRWYGSISLWHRLGCLFSTGALVINVHLHTSGSIPGLSQCSVEDGEKCRTVHHNPNNSRLSWYWTEEGQDTKLRQILCIKLNRQPILFQTNRQLVKGTQTSEPNMIKPDPYLLEGWSPQILVLTGEALSGDLYNCQFWV